jgi:non-ribosomal peptide synthetase component F
MAGQSTFQELLAQVRDVAVGAQAHQEVPFELIVQATGASGSTDDNPLFRVSFIVQERETEILRLPGLDVSIVHGHGGTAKFDLTAGFTLLESGLKCLIEYRTGVLDAAWIDGMLDDMRRLLTTVMVSPEEPLAERAAR